MKRRQFLQRTLQTATLLSTSAISSRRILGANERVRIGLIGCGGRGLAVAKLMRAVPNVEFVAVCDVYDPRIAAARDWAGTQARAFRDFRHVLELKEVDAVLIATPDHWHAIPSVLACEAGKDVYVEKPLGHNIREGRAVVKAAQRSGRLVAVGTQQRSAPHYAEAARLVHSGALGPVHFIRIWNYTNMHPHGIGRVPDSEPPPDADWDFFLGPAPKVPFNKNRFVNTYRWFWDYGGGMVTDFGIHRFDSMLQIMGTSDPITISASGRRYELNDGAETPDVVQVTYEFPNFILSYEATNLNALGTGQRTPGQPYYGARGDFDHPHGEAFYGANGTLLSNRLGFELLPELKAPTGPGAQGRRERAEGWRTERKAMSGEDATAAHARNFVECVRSRKPPAATVEMGHRASTIAHLGNIAFRTGRKIRWDAQQEEIPGDPEASRLLKRDARKPWDLI
ncbi:MAG: Gfo/Idh/MocA family oxidoreductase, partial [Verrucomicrobiota bacterium]